MVRRGENDGSKEMRGEKGKDLGKRKVGGQAGRVVSNRGLRVEMTEVLKKKENEVMNPSMQ
jgi:hypothetical protein